MTQTFSVDLDGWAKRDLKSVSLFQVLQHPGIECLLVESVRSLDTYLFKTITIPKAHHIRASVSITKKSALKNAIDARIELSSGHFAPNSGNWLGRDVVSGKSEAMAEQETDNVTIFLYVVGDWDARHSAWFSDIHLEYEPVSFTEPDPEPGILGQIADLLEDSRQELLSLKARFLHIDELLDQQETADTWVRTHNENKLDK